LRLLLAPCGIWQVRSGLRFGPREAARRRHVCIRASCSSRACGCRVARGDAVPESDGTHRRSSTVEQRASGEHRPDDRHRNARRHAGERPSRGNAREGRLRSSGSQPVPVIRSGRSTRSREPCRRLHSGRSRSPRYVRSSPPGSSGCA